MSETTGVQPPRHGNRLDALDGIRTIAVALVVLFHVSAPGFDAGYLGVDMFFVLSGYLITGGLIREVRAGQTPRLAKFWTRRFKRLLPAALLVIVTVLMWTFVGAPLYRRAGLATDAWWTSLYVANWRFIDSATYFSSDGTSSPLLHMWSLAVEEQFYVFWPLVVALVAWVSLRRRRDSRHGRGGVRRALLAIAILVVIASALLLWRLYQPDAPERAYMGTDAKAFEPMLGAAVALALSSDRMGGFVRRHTGVLVALGSLGLIALFLVLAGPAPFYFTGGAVLFSLATAAVIVGIALAPLSRAGRGLSFAPVSYLGRISYGIYLWHWPYAVWLGTAHTTFTWWRAALVVLVTVLTASASYHFLEMPIRQGRLSAWFTPRRTLGVALTTIALVTVTAGLSGGGPAARVVPPVQAAAGERPDAKTIMLVGDSVPLRLTPELAPAASARGLEIISAAAGGCSPLAVKQWSGLNDGFGLNCPEVADKQSEQIRLFNPGVVLWWSRYEIADRYAADGQILHTGTPGFWAAQAADFERAVDRLTSRGATLTVLLTERPGIGFESRCSPTHCVPFLRKMVEHDEWRVHWNDYVLSRARADSRIRTIVVDDLFCRAQPSPSASASASPTAAATSTPSASPTPSVPPGWGASLCDDTVSPGRLARPDGSHVDTALIGPKIANAILDRVLAVQPKP
jgi:peptidoglycan/LPS O-acetylase OafA/YrhL